MFLRGCRLFHIARIILPTTDKDLAGKKTKGPMKIFNRFPATHSKKNWLCSTLYSKIKSQAGDLVGQRGNHDI